MLNMGIHTNGYLIYTLTYFRILTGHDLCMKVYYYIFGMFQLYLRSKSASRVGNRPFDE